MPIYISIYIYILHKCISLSLSLYIYIYTYVCMCVNIYIYIYIYMYTHTPLHGPDHLHQRAHPEEEFPGSLPALHALPDAPRNNISA